MFEMHRAMAYYSAMWLCADFVEQKFVCKKEKYDVHKAGRSVAVGAGVMAPMVYSWMKIIEIVVPGRTLTKVLAKVCLDSLVFGPVVISSFYMSSSLLQGKDVQSSVEEWKQKVPPTLLRAWCVWPGVQLLNYAYVSPPRRVYVVATVSFFWSVFLCYMKDDSVEHKEIK